MTNTWGRGLAVKAWHKDIHTAPGSFQQAIPVEDGQEARVKWSGNITTEVPLKQSEISRGRRYDLQGS